jgi:small subunit ribosomal protein S16
MLKLRLKRTGRKRSPSYRLVIMENTFRRDGRPIEEVGYYNPITKQSNFDAKKLKMVRLWCKPTETVLTY